MAGTAISEMIFFIAAMIISSSVAVAFISFADDYSNSIADESRTLRSEMRCKMALINDPAYVPYAKSTSNITFYLKNTGWGELSTKDIVVSANGTAAAGASIKVKVMDGGTAWMPGDVVEVTFTVKNLRSGVDYQGWASTSGLTEKGEALGHADDTMTFRIKGA